MGEPLLKNRYKHPSTDAKDGSAMYISLSDSDPKLSDQGLDSPIRNKLSEIRENTLRQFAKKMTLRERRILEEVTQNIVEQIVSTSESTMQASCMRHDMADFEETIKDLFNQEK